MLAGNPNLDSFRLVRRPGISNLQLFPVSSLLIESMLLVHRIADGASALIQVEWLCAPREPDCACLFSLLESILCSVREDSCYYNSVLFFSSIPSFSVSLTSGRKQHAPWESSHSGRTTPPQWIQKQSFTLQGIWFAQLWGDTSSLLLLHNCLNRYSFWNIWTCSDAS